MLVVEQLEQDDPQPLHLPLTARKPRLQVVQKVPLVQVMQFREQPPQLPLTKTLPGRQVVQFVAAPTHVTQLRSQGRQVALER
jgi:hypothetical protein